MNLFSQVERDGEDGARSLSETAERVIYRGWHRGADGSRRPPQNIRPPPASNAWPMNMS